MARIEQTRGFKQTVKHFGGDRRKARKALRKAFKKSGEKWTKNGFEKWQDIGYAFVWSATPQGHDFWSDIGYNH